MVPVLYNGNEKEFISQGIGSLKDVVSCTVSEELNGAYELLMEYPVFGEHFSEIKLGKLILAEVAPRKQSEPFSIYKISKPLNGIVTINAEHISYRLSYIPVSPFTASTCSSALNGLVENSLEECPFTVWTDKNLTIPFSFDVPQSFRTCLGGIEGSILDVYRGEYEFNRYVIKLHTNRGIKKDNAKIIYGRNLIDLTQEESIENTVTGIVPYWKGNISITNSDDTTTSVEKVVTLPEHVMKSEYSGKYQYERTVVYDFSSDFQEEPTEEELRTACKEYMKNNLVGIPTVSLTVDFAVLSDYEENKDFASQIVYIGDKVPVIFEKYDISTEAEIVSTSYNVIEEKYESITLGNVRSSISKSISAIEKRQDTAIDQSELIASMVMAQKIINGGAGGYQITRFINGHPSETVWGDTDDVNTMVNCIRINRNGIGFSNNGINGPYVIAGTIDGHWSANFIDTGIIQDKKGINYINLDTGELRLGGYATSEDMKNLSDNLQGQINDANDSIANNYNNLIRYIRVENGQITLGAIENALSVVISNDRISFVQDGKEVAYITHNQLYITDAVFLNKVFIGNFGFVPRSNGSLSFKKVR